MSCPRLNRRELLGYGAAGALGVALGEGLTTEQAAAQTTDTQATMAVPFNGQRQAGITTPPPRNILAAVYDVDLKRRDELKELLRTISERGRLLSSGKLEEPQGDEAPPPDSGTLGSGGDPQALTVTLGLGGELFDRPGDPFGIATRRPSKLKKMPTFPGDDLDPTQTNGELLLQICSDDSLVAMHALRDIERKTRGALVPRVVHRGSQRRVAVNKNAGEVASGRGLLGFKDGTANPSAGDFELMNRLVWLGAREQGEPAWTRNGSYLVLRKIRDRIEAWDRETLRSQERLIGRRRDSGAPLDGSKESDEPNYIQDPEGKTTPLDSHIRRANPRSASSENERILRRGYPYFDGYDKTGLLDAGLLFICFQRNPEAQFEVIKQRLSPAGARPQGLDEYLTCVGGGYFFCPHGAVDNSSFVGDQLFA